MVLWVLKVLTGRGAWGCARSRRRSFGRSYRRLPGACARDSLRVCV